MKNLGHLAPPLARERDLSLEMTHRDENTWRNGGMGHGAPPKGATVKRSFSWGKKQKKKDKKGKDLMVISSEARYINLDRFQADNELGFEMHGVTGDVIVSHVGQSLKELEVGDCLLSIQGVQLVEGGLDALEAARHILREPGQIIEVIIQRHCVRTETLKRHAALRGTSLDKLGLTIVQDGAYVVITDLGGLAAKSKRFLVGDRLIAVNGIRCGEMASALELLERASNEGLEVELDLVYGWIPPVDHHFDPESALFVAKTEPKTGFGIVKRSLSFGKKKGSKAASASSSQPEAAGSGTATGIPIINFEPRHLDIPKNDKGMIQVTFKAHAITGELIIGLVGEVRPSTRHRTSPRTTRTPRAPPPRMHASHLTRSLGLLRVQGSPAAMAGVEVGDAVLAVQGNMIESEGEFALDDARTILAQTSHFDTVELMLQTKTRQETLEFRQKEPGAPRIYLGLSFYSFPGDSSVRITSVHGPAAKANRMALGDRIIAVEGIRVNHAQTLSEHVAAIARTSDYITFEVALGYAGGEGLWYGQDGGGDDPDKPRKAKRSFSFGRKPRH